MRRFRQVLAIITSCALLAAVPPCEGAPNHHSTTTYDDSYFDGQAYLASSYVPSLRPEVVGLGLLITTIIVLVLQNNQSSHS